MSRRPYSLGIVHSHWLLQHFCILFCRAPWALDGFDGDISFRTRHSVLCTLSGCESLYYSHLLHKEAFLMMVERDADHTRHIWSSVSLMSEKMCLRVSEFVPRTSNWESMSSELFSSRQRDEWDLDFPSDREIRGSRDVSDSFRRWCGVSSSPEICLIHPGWGMFLFVLIEISFEVVCSICSNCTTLVQNLLLFLL